MAWAIIVTDGPISENGWLAGGRAIRVQMSDREHRLELLILIHHPNASPRPLKELLVEVAGTYGRAMGSVAKQHFLELKHCSILLLRWPGVSLGWRHWHMTDSGTLATAGMPLLYAPPGQDSQMLKPDKLAALIHANGSGASSDLGYCGGSFAAAHAGADGQVRLVTNYLAEVPLYRAQGADGLTVWSTKAAAAALLAGIEPQLDQRAAREFILLSHPLADRTLWQGVQTEPPATCILIDVAGVRRQPYLKLPEAYFAHRRPAEQVARNVVSAMEPLIETLKASDAEARIHLSGGIDSRATAALCACYGYRPKCLTHNATRGQIPSARRLARFLRMPYDVVEAGPNDQAEFFDQAQASLWQSDGLMSLKFLCGQYDLDMIRSEQYIPIEGYGGEHGRAYYYDSEEAIGKLTKGLFETVFVKMLGGRGAMWPSPGGVDRIRNTITELLDDAQAAGLDPVATTTWMYVSQRMRRWAVARRNTGWQWVIDPLQMPCWTYQAMSADPRDQIGGRLVSLLADTAVPGAAGVATDTERAEAARKRRTDSNPLVRGTMKVYDGIRPRPQAPAQIKALKRLRHDLVQQIFDAAGLLPQILTVDVARGWLQHKPWSSNQTELFWNTATLAMWCKLFIAGPPAIGCAVET